MMALEGLVGSGGHSVGDKWSLADVLIFNRELGLMGSSTFEAAQIISISEHLREPMTIFSHQGGQISSSILEAAQVITISEHLEKPMLILSREVGQMGSATFEAAQIFPISEYLKEPMLTFRCEEGQLGSAASQGKTEAALRAVVQEAAVVPFMQWRPRWRPRARQLGSCLRRAGWAGGV